MDLISVNDKKFFIKQLLGKGKGGYSYLVENEQNEEFVVKQIHHEPCDYYNFGNKIEAEKNDYKRLCETGILIPRMYSIDETKETILKEYIKGDTAFTLVKNDALPQGSPTSPALSNIVMRRFDDQIGRWCNQRQITYTRYCDDMTFSSDRPLYGVYQKVKKMLFEMGFELNEAKTHFISNADRQTVTGLVVNEKLSIPSSYKRNLRQEIYYTLKFGIEDSIVHGNRLNFLEDGQPIRCPTYMTHLIGSVQYVLQIEPENRWFLNAKQKLLDYARAYFRAEGLGEEYYLHRSRLREKDE